MEDESLPSAEAEVAATATQTQPQPQRKRIGRPPKVSSETPAAATATATAVAATAAAAAAATRAAEESSEQRLGSDLAARTLTLSPTFSECRRSSRKKIIKFDVRDLLNKNRKTHKIQIEARIDSNATPLKAATTATTATPTAQPVSRRFSMFESSVASRQLRLLEKPTPPTPALEIFAKPKPTQSLIVAQVSSGSSSEEINNSVAAAAASRPNYININALPTPTAQSAPLPRKRGRPRKIDKLQCKKELAKALDASIGSCSDSDTNSTSNNSNNGSSEGDSSNKFKNSPQLRVAVKRLNMPAHRESSDSGESLKYSPLAIRVLDERQHRNENNERKNENQEVDLEAEHEPTTTLAVLTDGDDDDSDSQIIFVEIETIKAGEEEECEEEEVAAQLQHETETDAIVEPEPEPDVEEALSESLMQYFEQPEVEQVATQSEDDIIIELSNEPAKTWSDSEDEDEEVQSGSSLPIAAQSGNSRRRSQRGNLAATSNKKTLEETFAEIAAQSSKEILESETVEVEQQVEVEAMDVEAIEVDAVEEEVELIELLAEEEPMQSVEEQEELTAQQLIELIEDEIQSDESNVIQSEAIAMEIQLELTTEPPVDALDNQQSEAAETPLEGSLAAAPEEQQCEILEPQLVEIEPQETKALEEIEPQETKPLEEKSEQVEASQAEEPLEKPLLDDATASGKKKQRLEKSKDKSPQSLDKDKDKDKDKRAVAIVECDALFKAMDKATAQMRLEEKSKKKLKLKLEAKKQEQSTSKPEPGAHSPPPSRGTSSDSSRVSTPNLPETSAGSAAKRSRSGSGKKQPPKEMKATPSPSQRRSTVCVERGGGAADISPIPNRTAGRPPLRRNSLYPKVSPELMLRSSSNSPLARPLSRELEPEQPQAQAKKLTAKKKKKKAREQTTQSVYQRQDSCDSTSSASASQSSHSSRLATRKRKTQELELGCATEQEAALQAALTETESSESTSTSSCGKLRRFVDVGSGSGASPEPKASTQQSPPDPLKDIAKFIEDGVNLLKRDYKLDEEEEKAATAEADQTQLLANELNQETGDSLAAEFAQRVANMETPAMTPESTPAPSPLPNSEELVSCASAASTSASSSSSSATGGVRRSHRIKQKPQGPKASVGRGVVQDRNFSSDDGEAPISLEYQLLELATIESINEQFLRSESLNTFQMLRENYYRCARQVSLENAEMQCDCFLTGDEEAQGHLCCGAGCINRMLMIECGPLCSNGDRCTNKRFQKHQCWPCRVFRTEKKGCGITAELQIPPGEFIMEYVGEVIDSEEFERRQHLYSRDKNRHYYFMALRGEAIIDATAKGNISRYINHSCDPNAETQKWTVNGELRIGFFSRKPILPGEEITFDYQYQRYGRDAQRCYCESANCRGWIGGEPDSDEGEQLDSDSEDEYEDDAELLLEPIDSPELSRRKVSKAGKLKLEPSKAKIKLKLPRKRKEQPKAKDREYKAGRWLRPNGEKAPRKSHSKVNFHATLEDPDVLEELAMLSRSGLKNQVDTLRFSRCMVRAKLLQTRIQLLGVLTHGEMPCRRLFLDYHGLRLLYAWMNESGSERELRLALLQSLESLPIPNKTMLNESRVYQSVQLWSQPEEEQLEEKKQEEKEKDKEKEAEALPVESPPESASPPAEALRPRILALLQKWDALPEIFRIPKRERIEQMKEHEREADRHQPSYAATALEDSNNGSALDSEHRYRQQDRFRRDTSSRYAKPKPALMSGNNTICTITTNSSGSISGSSSSGGSLAKDGAGGRSTPSGSNGGGGGGCGGASLTSSSNSLSSYKSETRRRSEIGSVVSFERPKQISKELRREMFERKVAQDEAEKRVSSEDWREHEVRCDYFGADLTTDPKLLPFYHNAETDEWFNSEDMPVAAPLRCGPGNGSEPELFDDSLTPPLTLEPAEPLPPAWHWSLTAEGDIYYYNLRDRISQWEPPSAQQRLEKLVEPSSAVLEEKRLEDWPNGGEHDEQRLLIDIDVDYVGNLSPKSLSDYIESKIRERRELRRTRLVSVCVISPRREEDRVYNQIESRKYKENKEKIRRRKEVFRRRRVDAQSQPQLPSDVEPIKEIASAPLPIQGYLFSSDEESRAEADPVEAAVADSSSVTPTPPLLDASVDGSGDAQLDDLDDSRLQSPLSMEPSTSKSALAALSKKSSPTEANPGAIEGKSAAAAGNSKRKLPLPPLPEHKRQRGDREKRRKSSSSAGNLSSTTSGREATEKFRFEISSHVADFLRPYRKDSCQLGKITCDEDYKFLIKRLSHHITTKEMRYCDATGNLLACTESVKHKSYDFINQYMRKKGKVYKRPADEPDY